VNEENEENTMRRTRTMFTAAIALAVVLGASAIPPAHAQTLIYNELICSSSGPLLLSAGIFVTGS
jgi:hypothetical protein